MALVSSIIAEIRANCNEPSTVSEQFYTNEELIYYTRRSVDDMCIDTDANYFIHSLEIVGSSVGTITSINCSSVANMTLATHGLATRDTIYISGVTGTCASELNDYYWEITVLDANTFTVDKDLSDYAYTTGGTTLKMPLSYAFTSISASSTIKLADLKFLAYRSSDWDEWYYDDLPKVDPKTNVSFSAPNLRRQTCVVYNDKVYLAKGPRVSDVVLVGGRWLPTAVTTSGDTYPLGAIEEDATIKYVTSMCWLKKNKPEIASAWMNLYQERKKTIQIKRQRMVAMNYPATMAVLKKNDSLLDLLLRIPDEING